MKTVIYSLILISLCFSISLSDVVHLAVLPFSGHGVSNEELRKVAQAMRREINKANNFVVMPRLIMEDLLKDNNFSEPGLCDDISCALTMGEALSLDYVIQCRIGRVGKSFTFNLRFIEVSANLLIEDLAEYYNGTINKMIQQLIPQMVRQLKQIKLEKSKFSLNNQAKINQSNFNNPKSLANHNASKAQTSGAKVNTQLNKSGTRITPAKSELSNSNDTPHKMTIQTSMKKEKEAEAKTPLAISDNSSEAPIGWENDDQIEAIAFTGTGHATSNRVHNESISLLQLRSKPLEKLTPTLVLKMIVKYDFFCTHSAFSSQWSNNKGGNGTQHLTKVQGKPIVLDTKTNLLWQQTGSPNPIPFNRIQKYIARINRTKYGGYNDWRLPTLEEAMSLMKSKKSGNLFISNIFSRVQKTIWTSDKLTSDTAWVVRYDKGRCNYGTYKFARHIRLVRTLDRVNSVSKPSALSGREEKSIVVNH